MSKTKILLIQIAGCIALGVVLGVAFCLCDGGKTPKKVSEGQDVASNAQIKPIEIYAGKWHKDYLEVIKCH